MHKSEIIGMVQGLEELTGSRFDSTAIHLEDGDMCTSPRKLLHPNRTSSRTSSRCLQHPNPEASNLQRRATNKATIKVDPGVTDLEPLMA